MVVVIVMYGQIGIICDNDYARCFLLKKNKTNNNKITSRRIL